MSRRLQSVWFPAIAFAFVAVASGIRITGTVWAAYSSVAAILLTMLLWRGLVVGNGRARFIRGSIAGALIGILAQVLPGIVAVVSFRAVHGRGEGGSAGLMDFAGLFIFAISGGMAACAGVVAGGAVAFVQRKTAAAHLGH